MSALTVREWDAAAFAAGRDPWNALLESSLADRLFLRWEWQYAWWRVFAEPLGLSLRLLTARDRDGQLVGIAPLYRHTARLRNLLPVKRIQFIGNCWRGTGTIRTEHVDFIARRELHLPVVEAFLAHLTEAGDWDELVISDLRVDSPTYRFLAGSGSACRGYLRQAELYGSYYVSTDGPFQGWAAALGKNTRLRMLNRRSLLQQSGEVELTEVPLSRFDEFFAALNQMHAGRWGEAAFDERRMRFNRLLAELLPDARRCTLLTVAGRPCSALYNFRVGEDEYYIRGGFDEAFHKKLALGYLHLGYAIEAAFSDPGIRRFNLLAGGGKNSQYKEHLNCRQHLIADVQLVRQPLMNLAYRAYDRWQGRRPAAAALDAVGY